MRKDLTVPCKAFIARTRGHGSVGIMTLRRDFLKTAAGVGTLGANQGKTTTYAACGIAVARKMVRRGDLGVIHFCRIAHPQLHKAVAYILDQADCVIGVEPGAEGAAFLGSRGTLVVRGDDCQVFAQES